MLSSKRKRCMARAKIDVGMSAGAVAVAPTLLTSAGLGSCVVLALHDPAAQLGGLAHVMLPDSAQGQMHLGDYACADTALAALLMELDRAGAARRRLVARLAGGALMFPELMAPGEGIGPEIGRRLKVLLEQAGIRLVGQDLGGHHGRSVEFDLATGLLRVSALEWPEKAI